MLPGTLRINRTQEFICKPVTIRQAGSTFLIPIAHSEGNYYHPNPREVKVAYTYTEDINGSINNIAGVYNDNVLGMMPHPERAFETYHCSQDGFNILEGFCGRRSKIN